MADLIRHRGPDGEGCYADGTAALGHRRLSVIDLAGGGQPMLNEDGTLGGVFNGSIMTEIIFSYPGVGTLIQKAILQSDYNMILGCITISIVAISTATLIADLIYPLIDPRIRYS